MVWFINTIIHAKSLNSNNISEATFKCNVSLVEKLKENITKHIIIIIIIRRIVR